MYEMRSMLIMKSINVLNVLIVAAVISFVARVLPPLAQLDASYGKGAK